MKPLKKKHIPIRTCVGCGERKAKFELVRIAFDDTGNILLDPRQKLPGRGAYLCKNETCYEIAAKRKKLDRAFRRSVPASTYECFKDEFKKWLMSQNSNRC